MTPLLLRLAVIFSLSRCQLAHLIPLKRCSGEKLFWFTWEERIVIIQYGCWVEVSSHSFYTPSLSLSLSSLEVIRPRSGREIKNKQKDNPRPGSGSAGLVG